MCTENRATVVAERHTGSPLKAQWRREGLSEPRALKGRLGGHLVPRGQGPRRLLATSAPGRLQGWPLEPRGCREGARQVGAASDESPSSR